jgi:hypothetical protein
LAFVVSHRSERGGSDGTSPNPLPARRRRSDGIASNRLCLRRRRCAVVCLWTGTSTRRGGKHDEHQQEPANAGQYSRRIAACRTLPGGFPRPPLPFRRYLACYKFPLGVLRLLRSAQGGLGVLKRRITIRAEHEKLSL